MGAIAVIVGQSRGGYELRGTGWGGGGGRRARGKPCFEGVGSRSKRLFLPLTGEGWPLETTGTKSHPPRGPQWSLIISSRAARKPQERWSAALPQTPAPSVLWMGTMGLPENPSPRWQMREGSVDSSRNPRSQVITAGASPSRSCPAAPGEGLIRCSCSPAPVSVSDTNISGRRGKQNPEAALHTEDIMHRRPRRHAAVCWRTASLLQPEEAVTCLDTAQSLT